LAKAIDGKSPGSGRSGLGRWGRRRSSREPFSGWTILSAAGLAVFLSGPAQTYGVSPFVDPMLSELGWSRSLFSAAYSAGTLASAGALLLLGRQIDRWGNRLVLSLAAVAFAAALLIMGAVGGVATLLLGFALLRTCGSGVVTLAARTLIPHWFVRRRGRAFSLLGLAATLSLALFPATNEFLIGVFGWRGAWRANAVLILLVLLPIVAFVVRDRPEAVGQHPDGVPPADGEVEATSAVEPSFALGEALRAPAFWGLLGASVVPSLVVTGLAFNQVAIFTERGLPSTIAAITFTVESLVGLPVTLMAGWLVDRYPLRYILAAGQLCLLVAMLALLAAHSPALALLYSAWRGASSGLWTVAADVAWPAYFGRRHLGSIRGVGFAVGVVGAAIGPVSLGLAYDFLGGYDAAIAGLLLLPVIAAAAVVRARPPQKE
jgi:MFS family permease